MFSMAFNSGQLGPLVREFGLTEAAIAAADKGNMQDFVQVNNIIFNLSKLNY